MEQTDGTAHPVTLTRMCQKARCFMITNFNDELKHFEKATYEITCDDVTKDGRHHQHQVVHFKNPISFNTLKKAYPTAHIEVARNVYDAIHYIKDNTKGKKYNIEERGVEPVDTRFKTVKDLKECNDPELLDWKQFNTWQRIHDNDEIDINDMSKNVKVYYISGPSGCGKTEKAKQIIRDNVEHYGSKLSMVKYSNGFWLNVGSNRRIALYDDFRDSHMPASEFINFIDYNKHPMNMKGTSCTNDYELIIITSVQPLESIYGNLTGEPRQQWIRRVEEIKIKINEEEEEDDEIDIDALIDSL